MSSSPEVVEISIVHGDTESYLVTVTDTDANPVDLSVGELTVTARTRPGGAVLFTKSMVDNVDGSDGIAPGTDEGTAILTINATDLLDVDNDWETVGFDVRFTPDDPDDGGPRTPIKGQLRVLPSLSESSSS